ncbi:hypothetical protein BVRB_1g002340 isoform A [Beta vulgaris subsp. vulgaris]|nr:hypothetical protein BVRB_1g002340 isoform A [Beta vulgaris subsp. vulgaris]
MTLIRQHWVLADLCLQQIYSFNIWMETDAINQVS